MSKYYDCWQSKVDVENDYSEVENILEEDIIYAGYTYEDYSGDAFVVFRKDGKLYSNNDGHCSCYGLENWRPEETSLEALKMMPKDGGRYGGYWPGLHEELEKL